MSEEFKPDWTLAPAATLREWMKENGLTPGELAVACLGRQGKSKALALIEDVLSRKPLTREHATMLWRGTGVASSFWLGFEHNYRAGLAAGLTDVSES
jgi:plasmid maintenance system antidote protein VapI